MILSDLLLTAAIEARNIENPMRGIGLNDRALLAIHDYIATSSDMTNCTLDGATFEMFCQAYIVCASATKTTVGNIDHDTKGIFLFRESDWSTIIGKAFEIDPDINILTTFASAIADIYIMIQIGVAYLYWYATRNDQSSWVEDDLSEEIAGFSQWSISLGFSNWFQVAALVSSWRPEYDMFLFAISLSRTLQYISESLKGEATFNV